MSIVNLKSAFRFCILSWYYPKAFFSFFLKCLSYFPFISFGIERFEETNNNHIDLKGHIMLGKKIYFKNI